MPKKQTEESKVRSENKTLTDRGSVYGPYGSGVDLRQHLLLTIVEAYTMRHGTSMTDREVGYFWDICNKLSRLAITPQHMDSWHDIAGYASLIEADIKDSGEGI